MRVKFEAHKKVAFYLICFLGSLFVTSCEYIKYKKIVEGERSPIRLTKEEIDGLSFQKIKSEVLNEYCLSCHRDQNRTDKKYPLVTYAEVFSRLSEIYDSVFVKETMPQRKVLSSRARSLLQEWINIGAPEFAKNPTSIPVELPIQPRFSSIRDRIFNVRCGYCHNPQSRECLSLKSVKSESISIDGEGRSEIESPEEGGYSSTSCEIDLGNYNNLLWGKEELITPGNVEESWLVHVVQGIDGEAPEMPPPDSPYTPLNSEEIQAIKDWILSGALNN